MTPKTDGYAVTQQLVKDLEAFISRYVTFADASYTLPIALWTIATYIFPTFDAFPYLTITSDTKRSGKTRCAEIISFGCANPRMSGAMTAAAMFSTIDEESPTMFFDEAETLSSEAQGVLTAMLNMGYRKGSEILRKHGNEVVSFKVYCPKVFILIGDVRDTLKDRSIIVRMKRAEPKERFVYNVAQMEGQELRSRIEALVGNAGRGRLGQMTAAIDTAFQDFKGITFLTDRDEEIWSSLFVIAQTFCPERTKELQKTATDMSVEKTQESRRYVNLLGEESKAMDDEYAVKLLKDLAIVIGKKKGVTSQEAVAALKEIDTAPWRKYRGNGLDVLSMADMLSRFNVSPKAIRVGKGDHGNKNVFKGYSAVDVARAIKDNNL